MVEIHFNTSDAYCEFIDLLDTLGCTDYKGLQAKNTYGVAICEDCYNNKKEIKDFLREAKNDGTLAGVFNDSVKAKDADNGGDNFRLTMFNEDLIKEIRDTFKVDCDSEYNTLYFNANGFVNTFPILKPYVAGKDYRLVNMGNNNMVFGHSVDDADIDEVVLEEGETVHDASSNTVPLKIAKALETIEPYLDKQIDLNTRSAGETSELYHYVNQMRREYGVAEWNLSKEERLARTREEKSRDKAVKIAFANVGEFLHSKYEKLRAKEEAKRNHTHDSDNPYEIDLSKYKEIGKKTIQFSDEEDLSAKYDQLKEALSKKYGAVKMSVDGDYKEDLQKGSITLIIYAPKGKD